MNKERDLLEIMKEANTELSKTSDRISAHHDLMGQASLPSFDSLNERRRIVEDTLQAVAHEIPNPLLAAGGFARKLARSLEPDTKGGGYVRIILEETSRLERALCEMTTDNR